MKTIKVILIYSLVCIISFSCSKESSLKINEEPSEPYSTKKSNFDFEIYGRSHNLAMDFVGNAPRFEDMSSYERYLYIHEYSDDDFSYDISDTNWVEFQNTLNFGIELANDPKNAASLLLQQGIITSLEYNLIDSLFMIFEEAADFDNQTFISIEEFNQKVNLLEDHIYRYYPIQYDEITKEGNFAAHMLAACSIMRHSFLYWREAVTNENHPWHKIRTMNVRIDENGNFQRALFGKVWQGIKVAGVDVGVFLWSICSEECRRPKEDPGFGPACSISCAWGAAGIASSNV